MTIDEYMREFKARVQMCEELDSNIRHNIDLQKGGCDEQQLRNMDMLGETSIDNKAKWKKIKL